jgi:hypothetical protein
MTKQYHLKVTVDMMKTLLLQPVTTVQVEVTFMFGKEQNTFGILVVSILPGGSLWIEHTQKT